MKFINSFIMVLAFYTSQVFAHEMVPAYPELRPSYLDGLYLIELSIFNRRNDVTYYEIGVFDEEWNPLPFATNKKILKLEYLNRSDIEIYVRKSESDKIVYICTTSKLIKGEVKYTGVTSRICSKIKRDKN